MPNPFSMDFMEPANKQFLHDDRAYQKDLCFFEMGYEDLIGKELGCGGSRKVFQHKEYKDCVIKAIKVYAQDSFANVIENRIWEISKELGIREWLAPCASISRRGQVLVQEKVQPLTDDQAREVVLPKFLCDVKRANLGVLDWRIVCCDYQVINFRSCDTTLRPYNVLEIPSNGSLSVVDRRVL